MEWTFKPDRLPLVQQRKPQAGGHRCEGLQQSTPDWRRSRQIPLPELGPGACLSTVFAGALPLALAMTSITSMTRFDRLLFDLSNTTSWHATASWHALASVARLRLQQPAGHLNSCTTAKRLSGTELLPANRHRAPALPPPQLLAGVSGVDLISRFDASEFPTKFAAQVRCCTASLSWSCPAEWGFCGCSLQNPATSQPCQFLNRHSMGGRTRRASLKSLLLFALVFADQGL